MHSRLDRLTVMLTLRREESLFNNDGEFNLQLGRWLSYGTVGSKERKSRMLVMRDEHLQRLGCGRRAGVP